MARRGGGSFRGGSGSSRGARGGPSRPTNLDWMNEDATEVDFGPTPMFPKIEVKIPPPLSKKEQDQVNKFLAFKKEINDGPTYAIIGNTSQTERYATFDAAQVDPFQGLPTYSNKYKKKKRTLPDLSGVHYERECFPEELWSTLKIKPEPTVNGKGKRKRARDEDDASDGEAADGAGGKRPRLPGASGEVVAELDHTAEPRKIIEDEDEEDEEKEKEQEDSDEEADDSDDEPEEEEEKDDEFSDDEDDDYNAEQYFDDGSDRFEDGEDDGHGDGDTY